MRSYLKQNKKFMVQRIAQTKGKNRIFLKSNKDIVCMCVCMGGGDDHTFNLRLQEAKARESQ